MVKNLPITQEMLEMCGRHLGLIPGSRKFSGGGNGNPLQYSCLENFTDRGAWWATVHEVTKNQARVSRHKYIYKGD